MGFAGSAPILQQTAARDCTAPRHLRSSLPVTRTSATIPRMSLSRTEILHVARLARLDLRDEELETIGRQLAAVLDYIASLAALPTDEVEPTTHTESSGTPLREDVSRPSLPREEALRGAPGADPAFFKVPRVVSR